VLQEMAVVPSGGLLKSFNNAAAGNSVTWVHMNQQAKHQAHHLLPIIQESVHCRLGIVDGFEFAGI